MKLTYIYIYISLFPHPSSLRPDHLGDASNASLRLSLDRQIPSLPSSSHSSSSGSSWSRSSNSRQTVSTTAPAASAGTATVHCSSSPVAFTLHVLMAGGVFRWLQIGCNDDFGRKVEVI
jgi:hypothetical protein